MSFRKSLPIAGKNSTASATSLLKMVTSESTSIWVVLSLSKLGTAEDADSCSTRLGLESEEECFSILPLLNSTPLTHVTLHPRIASQQYKGEVHLDAFCRFANECQHPLIYNGDLTTLEDLHRIETEFPHLCSMMIGRGLLARPSLAREYAEGKEWTLGQRIHLITRMHARLHEHYASIIPSETQLLSKLRTFWDFMEPTFGHKTIKKIQKAGNLKNYLAAIP